MLLAKLEYRYLSASSNMLYQLTIFGAIKEQAYRNLTEMHTRSSYIWE